MPTGCRSVYLKVKSQQRIPPRGNGRQCAPAGDLEGGAEDLGPYEFRHVGKEERRASTRVLLEGRGKITKRTAGGKGCV